MELKPKAKAKPKWTGLLIQCVALKVGESLTVEISDEMIPRFRAMLRVSGRTARWRWTVKKLYLAHDASFNYSVTKVGLWR